LNLFDPTDDAINNYFGQVDITPDDASIVFKHYESGVRRMKQLFAVLALVLTMTFGSVPAYASPISYNFKYNPWKTGLGTDDVFLDVTIFLDDSVFPSSGTAFVVPDSVEVFFATTSSFSNAVFSTFANNQTSGSGPTREPFNIKIDSSGAITSGGELKGLQRLTTLSGGACTASGKCGIEILQFTSTGLPGGPFGITFFTAGGGGPPFGGETGAGPDTSKLVSSTGPIALPVPATALLFGSALGILGWIRKRKAVAPVTA